ncbi:hypothetical protein MKZ38_009267 [Zalerion maritima]|uniref:PKS/mFAS DH domain-containing protein n=1 Tax=Zalerion maritima TaxID=339359 RepID=A0AAD5RGZ1_9PEZI|nr:hypothetical protein MKZ38_009267 [Zalerion maritima]
MWSANAQTGPTLAFVFTGQGAQWYAMGRELYAHPAFRESLEAAEQYLSMTLGSPWNLNPELWRDAEKESRLGSAHLGQPICTALQVALVDLLKVWGIKPAAVVGHSSGEIAAAYAKGAITREFAWAIAYYRGGLSSRIRDIDPSLNGAMLATGLGPDAAEAYIARLAPEHGAATVAFVISPSSTTLSGDLTAIRELEKMIKQDDHFARKLRIDTAYHSAHMKAVADKYLAALALMVPLPEDKDSKDAVKMFSSLTGREVCNADLGPEYWVGNMVSQVKFSEAVSSMLAHSGGTARRRTKKKGFVEHMLEVGPHSALQGPLKQILAHEIASSSPIGDVTYTSVLERGKNAQSWRGQWRPKHAFRGQERRVPGWHAGIQLEPQRRTSSVPKHADSISNEPRYRNILKISKVPWVQYHKVQGAILCPAAGMMITAIEAMCQRADGTHGEIDGYEPRDVLIGKAIVVPQDDSGVETMLAMKPSTHGRRFGNSTAPACSRTKTQLGTSSTQESIARPWKAAARRKTPDSSTIISTQSAYTTPAFSRVSLRSRKGTSKARAELPSKTPRAPCRTTTSFPHVIHPATLASIIQMVLPALTGADEDMNEAIVPVSIGNLLVSAEMPTEPGVVLASRKAPSSIRWCQGNEAENPTGGSSKSSMASLASLRKLISVFHWQEDLSLLEPSQINKLCAEAVGDLGQAGRQALKGLEMASLIFIKRALEECSPEEAEGFAWNFKLYYQYMQRCHQRAKAGALAYQRYQYPEGEDEEENWLALSPEREAEIISRVAASTADGAVLVQHGEHLPQILRSELPPLQILMKNNFLGDFYQFVEYTLTDISIGYFEKAKEKLAPWVSFMKFAKLNSEEDPVGQGFKEGGYDMVVASTVLHATHFLGETLKNTRKLLKHDGKLVLSEITNPADNMRFHMIVGSLEGWWYGEEDGCHYGPTLNQDQWDTAFLDAGFSGLELGLKNFEDEGDLSLSVMITSASPPTSPLAPNEVLIVLPTSPEQDVVALADKTTARLAAQYGSDVSRAVGVQEAAAIPISELEPRSFRSEDHRLKLTTVDVEHDVAYNTKLGAKATDALMKIFISRGCLNKSAEKPDWEYAVRSSHPLVQCVLIEKNMNDLVATYNVAPKPRHGTFLQEGRKLTLSVGTPGRLDTLRFGDASKDAVKTYLGDLDIEIKVKAAGLNFKDVMVAMGQLSQPGLGLAYAGIHGALRHILGRTPQKGLGRFISEWMAESGARDILLLSRSGAKKATVRDLVARLEKQGARVGTWECDVGEEQQFIDVMERIQTENWPPITGVIQGAMAFVGIAGSRGQGNYSAGNSFENSIAHHRRSIGLKARSIDVGMVLGVGFLAEETTDARVHDIARDWSFIGILQADMTGGAEKFPWWLNDAKFAYLVNVDTHQVSQEDGEDRPPLLTQLQQAATLDHATDLVWVALVKKLAKSMMVRLVYSFWPPFPLLFSLLLPYPVPHIDI